MCPYYNTDDKTCNFFRTLQSEGQISGCCLSDSNWRRCANYEMRSFEEKARKKVRPNPDL